MGGGGCDQEVAVPSSGPAANATTPVDLYVGRLSGGDVVVALFNRKSDAQNAQVNFNAFASYFGSPPPASVVVRNVWEMRDVGNFPLSSGGVNATLQPHETLLLRIKSA